MKIIDANLEPSANVQRWLWRKSAPLELLIVRPNKKRVFATCREAFRGMDCLGCPDFEKAVVFALT